MDSDPHPIPITDELDLHTFRASEVGDLLPAYFDECHRLGIKRVRVIHGKGTGQLRTKVHSIIRKLPQVEDFTYPDSQGNWGATVVFLK